MVSGSTATRSLGRSDGSVDGVRGRAVSGPSADYFTGHGVVIHFSAKFPVERTACGTPGPSAALWRYVTCPGCLDVAPRDPRIEERRRVLGLSARG